LSAGGYAPEFSCDLVECNATGQLALKLKKP
jgi:hypothetical protein